MKPKRISIHALSLLTWLLSVVVYIYSQNNIYSCCFVFLLLFYLSKTYLHMRWMDLLYSWLFLSLGLMLFYGLFLHEGDTVLFFIPGNVPLLSGLISVNSILYGFFLGGSLSLAIFMFSLFSAFLREQRPRFYFPGIWANVSVLFSFLSYFVSFFLHYRDEFYKKIGNRDLSLSPVEKIRLFIHDSAFHSLENAFSFAETLEMRGFSGTHHADRKKFSKLDIGILSATGCLLFFLVIYRIYHSYWILLGISAILAFIGLLFGRSKKNSLVSQKYDHSFSKKDLLMMAWSFIFFSICVFQSIRTHSFLSRQQIQEYFHFDRLIHGLFFIHIGMAVILFPEKKVLK